MALAAPAVPTSTAGMASAPGPTGVQTAATPVTHGDLVVGPGQTFVIQPNAGIPIYYQGGNITVESGGTLIVRDVTLSFVEFVSNTGTAMQRLSHIYHFVNEGTVDFYNATVTTDLYVINAYAKLNLTDFGTLSAWNSVFAFPGWIYLEGGSAVATFNASIITANPTVAQVSELAAIQGDTLWAPTLSVVGGAQLNLFGSRVLDTYADNTVTAGFPRPSPLTSTGGALGTHGTVSGRVSGANDSQNLPLDWSYPQGGAYSGAVTVTYVDTNGPGTKTNSNDTTALVNVSYDGTVYTIGAALFKNSSSTSIEVPFSAPLRTAITSAGMLNYLNYTGDFGVTPGKILVSVWSETGPSVALSQLQFQLNESGPTNDLLVSGTGSMLSAVDTAIAVNWTTPGAGPYSQSSPYPWTSNKLRFENGAVGYLANLTTPAAIPGVFSTSAVLPDTSSQVYFYRWAQFALTGRGGDLAVSGATATAFYAYNSNQTNNATANSLNALSSANPAIWGYVQYWDAAHGVTGYGVSNSAGVLSLLLAAGELSGPTLPDGVFLGGYHIGFTAPSALVGSVWYNGSVSPYPMGVASNTPNYNGPDVGPTQNFPNYYGQVGFSVIVTANQVPNATATVRFGQTLGMWVYATDNGTAIVSSMAGALFWGANTSGQPLATFSVSSLDLNTPGQTYQFNLTWLANDTVIGQGTQAFEVALAWNGGLVSQGGGIVDLPLNVQIAPSQIRVVSGTVPGGVSYQLSQSYQATVTAQYNGSKAATINLYTYVNGAQVYVGTATADSEVPTTIFWSTAQLSAGQTYTLYAAATYNGVTSAPYVVTTFSIPAATTSSTGFLFQNLLGLPFWLWIAIAVAIVAGVVAFLFLARRQAAGKLVECGECGSLIPEDAAVCPKCGAEFEKDLIRCSRCASTIPADSKYCPECAAQLLGKPGEGGEEAERQGYQDFTEKYRAEGKRELGENYSEGGFWDWWKRQPTYTSFSQWKLQQGQGTPRGGMSAPPAGTIRAPEPPSQPPKGGGGGGVAAAEPAAGAAAVAPTPEEAPAAGAAPPAAGAAAAPGASLKPCPNCGKEIPPDYLVCPFCGAVTQ